MNTDSQYITALEAMQQANLPPDVFVALLRSHETELPLFRNDEEMTIRKAIEHGDFRCIFWRDIHRKFYSKELQNADTYLRYFKLYLPQWQQFVATHKEEVSFDLPLAEGQGESLEPVEDAAAEAEAGVDAHIAAWEAVIPELTPKEQRIAKIVIEKWRGKSHLDCYMAVYGDACIEEDSKIKKISRAKNAAVVIARHYALEVPPWTDQS